MASTMFSSTRLIVVLWCLVILFHLLLNIDIGWLTKAAQQDDEEDEFKQVYLLTSSQPDSQELHFILPGLATSAKLELSTSIQANIWIVNQDSTNCLDLEQALRKRHEEEEKVCSSSSLTCKTTEEEPQLLEIYMMDYGDKPRLKPCEQVHLFANNNTKVQYYKRSMVEGRTQDSNGHVANYTPYKNVHHLPYGVRPDMVQYINKTLAAQQQSNKKNTTTVKEKIAVFHGQQYLYNPVTTLLERPGGARYFWFHPHMSRGWKKGVRRSQVAQALWNLSSVKIGIAGKPGGTGRGILQQDYIQDLLKYKIVVVCQPDKWEGHYRFMEALSGGAMVLSDYMWLPPKYLINGTSYVVYNSTQDLKSKIQYYLNHDKERLQIANEGWHVAMTHYQSRHIVEAMILRNEHWI